MTKCVIGDLMEVTRGASLAGKYYATAGDKIRLTLANFDYANNCFKPDTSKDNVFYTQAVDDRFVLKEGDIITPLTEQTPGLLGTTARIPESGKYIQSQDVALLKPFTEKLDPDYCFYLVSSKAVRNQLGAMSQQTKIRHSSPDKIKSCTVFLPELEKQRRIGAFLSAIDRKIALNRKRIATLEAMAKEIYDYWFVQFDFPDAHGRPYKSSGGAMVYNPDLKREIPKGWEVKSLGELMKTNASSYNERTLPSRIQYVDIAAVSNGVVSSKTEYDREQAPGRARRIAKSGDTIWSSVRPNLRAYALVLNPQEGDVFSTGFTVLSPVEVPYGFLYLTVTTEAYVSYLVSRTANSAYPAVLPSAFGEYEIAVPPRDLLDRFADQTEGMFELRQNCFDEIQIQTSLRDFLLPLLMNGQVKVA